MTDSPPRSPRFPSDKPLRRTPGEAAVRARLEREAEFFPRLFLNHATAPRLAQAYLRAHFELPDLCSASEAESKTVRVIVDHKLDALAIEPWLRGGPRRHLLSRKLLLVAYVMECDGCHPEIRQAVTGRSTGITRLCVILIASAVRMMRGRLQIMIHGLV